MPVASSPCPRRLHFRSQELEEQYRAKWPQSPAGLATRALIFFMAFAIAPSCLALVTPRWLSWLGYGATGVCLGFFVAGQGACQVLSVIVACTGLVTSYGVRLSHGDGPIEHAATSAVALLCGQLLSQQWLLQAGAFMSVALCGSVIMVESLLHQDIVLFGVHVFLAFFAARHQWELDLELRCLFLDENRLANKTHQFYSLLATMLPKQLVEQYFERCLQDDRGSGIAPQQMHSISFAHRRLKCGVLFVALCDFDELFASGSLKYVVKFLNLLFSSLDAVCEQHDEYVTKIETIGAVHMSASGLFPVEAEGVVREEHHLEELAQAAIGMHEFAESFGKHLRAGIHYGDVVAGIVGQSLPRFRLFGDTVNVAARLERKSVIAHLRTRTLAFEEQHCPAGASLLSEASAEVLGQLGRCPRAHGHVEMKGLGQMKTFRLDGESKSKEKTLRRRERGSSSSTRRFRSTSLDSSCHSESAQSEHLFRATAPQRRHSSAPLTASPGVHFHVEANASSDEDSSEEELSCRPLRSAPQLEPTALSSDSSEEELPRCHDKYKTPTTWLTFESQLGGLAQDDASKTVAYGSNDRQGVSMTIHENAAEDEEDDEQETRMQRAQSLCLARADTKVIARLEEVLGAAQQSIPSTILRWLSQACRPKRIWQQGSRGECSLPSTLLQRLGSKVLVDEHLDQYPQGNTKFGRPSALMPWIVESCLDVCEYGGVACTWLLWSSIGHSFCFTILPWTLVSAGVRAHLSYPGLAVLGITATFHYVLVGASWSWSMAMAAAASASLLWASQCISGRHCHVKSLQYSTHDRMQGVTESLMPSFVVRELREARFGNLTSSCVCHNYKVLTVSQADLVGFTAFARTKRPEEVVCVVNGLFSIFDRCVAHRGAYKMETIGDAYVCVSGVEHEHSAHSALSMLRLSTDFISAIQEYRTRCCLPTDLGIRIGLHTGPCVGAVVGTTMMRYHLFGKTMAITELMESTARTSTAHFSQATLDLAAQEVLAGQPCWHLSAAVQTRPGTLCTSKGQAVPAERIDNLQTYVLDPSGKEARAACALEKPGAFSSPATASEGEGKASLSRSDTIDIAKHVDVAVQWHAAIACRRHSACASLAVNPLDVSDISPRWSRSSRQRASSHEDKDLAERLHLVLPNMPSFHRASSRLGKQMTEDRIAASASHREASDDSDVELLDKAAARRGRQRFTSPLA